MSKDEHYTFPMTGGAPTRLNAPTPSWDFIIHNNSNIEAVFLASKAPTPSTFCADSSYFWSFFGVYSALLSVTLDGSPYFADTFTSFMPINYYGTLYCGVPVILSGNKFNSSVSTTPPGTYHFSVGGRAAYYYPSQPVIRHACTNPQTWPLYTSRISGGYHNSYMSTDYGLHLSALSQGYAAASITGRLEPYKTRNDSHAFIQFFNQGFINHYYGWHPNDIAYVLGNGWQQIRTEGYIYSTQVPGTVPLSVLWKNWNGNWDVEHRYTTSASEKNNWVQQGFGDFGIMGYICP